jgi:hypothetical protein
MEHDRLENQDVPRDPALVEAFEAFVHHTQVPRDFHAQVMARVQQRRARRERWGWWKSFGAWWTQEWSPIGVYAATVCGLLSLALNLGFGYYIWNHKKAVTSLRQELTAAQAQVHQVQASLDAQTQQAARRQELTDTHELLTTLLVREQQAPLMTLQEPGGAPAPGATPPGAVESVPSSALAMAQGWVRAKVGIQVRSGERTAPAKTTEMVKPGDFLRVYVVPEDDAYVYVVHNDGNTVSLLNAQDARTKVRKGVPVTFPAADRFYQIDGTRDKEAITVICSPTEIRKVVDLFISNAEARLHINWIMQQNWLSLEQELLDKSGVDWTQPSDRPFQIAAHVRSNNNDPFMETLQIVLGKSFVVKKYDFQVQK